MKNTLQYFLAAILFIALIGCTDKNEKTVHPETKTEVLVLGAIHSGHLTDSVYNTAYLERLFRVIKPDYILAEIPPNRFEEALAGFERDDSISEPRVMRFPEYTDVAFPLMKELNFEIIPTAGWTQIMAQERSAKLRAISQDSSRVEDWKAYQEANRRSSEAYKATGKVNDPYFIHTDAYDSIQDIALQEYNRLFNEELGLGGWENINIAHYWNIEKAIEKHRNKGKRMLIIYGAGHKGWFLRELRKRNDITLLEMKPFLDQIK